MNIGYLDQNGVTSTPEANTTNGLGSTLPRPASAGAAAVPSRTHEDTILYDYPPSTIGPKTPPAGGVSRASSRHRGVSNLRKQHSVSCANHCCESGPRESKTKV